MDDQPADHSTAHFDWNGKTISVAVGGYGFGRLASDESNQLIDAMVKIGSAVITGNYQNSEDVLRTCGLPIFEATPVTYEIGAFTVTMSVVVYKNETAVGYSIRPRIWKGSIPLSCDDYATDFKRDDDDDDDDDPTPGPGSGRGPGDRIAIALAARLQALANSSPLSGNPSRPARPTNLAELFLRSLFELAAADIAGADICREVIGDHGQELGWVASYGLYGGRAGDADLSAWYDHDSHGKADVGAKIHANLCRAQAWYSRDSRHMSDDLRALDRRCIDRKVNTGRHAQYGRDGDAKIDADLRVQHRRHRDTKVDAALGWAPIWCSLNSGRAPYADLYGLHGHYSDRKVDADPVAAIVALTERDVAREACDVRRRHWRNGMYNVTGLHAPSA